ncbi:MAG TPA: hypothetical protein VFV78_07360 [Vicinamibacterales bacterium]|nr:hypothetical protein [Vicinamibacterales bacterium]
MALRLRRGLGWILNALGVPGFMRAAPCEHRLGIPVEVTIGRQFTVIHVRNVKLFFDRITGRFDGVSLEGEGCADRSRTR